MKPTTYLQIASELKKQMAAGALQPGEKVPSTRELMRRFGVAMATATKALALLQREGLVRSVRGAGSVVLKAPTPGLPEEPPATPTQLSTEQVTEASIQIADQEGLDAVSLRKISASLGVSPMALYRYMPNKEALLGQMSALIFAKAPLLEPSTRSWRSQLEAIARLQWRLYQAHPWLVRLPSFTQLIARKHTERILHAIENLPLTPTERFQVAATLSGYVRGMAHQLAAQLETKEATQEGSLPAASSLSANPEIDLGLEGLFDFGLRRLLDGFAVFFGAK